MSATNEGGGGCVIWNWNGYVSMWISCAVVITILDDNAYIAALKD